MYGLGYLKRVSAGLRKRNAGVALIIALITPMLIGVTGLSVDVGYWYQRQGSIQSAADAAALAAAMNDVRLGATTSQTKQAKATPVAVAEADSATSSQFNFAAGNAGTSLALSASLTGTTFSGSTKYTATAQIPRAGFFSPVAGIGLGGLGMGSQYASATAIIQYLSTGQCNGAACCWYAENPTGVGVYINGGAKLISVGCGGTVFSNSCTPNNNDGNSIVAEPSGTISGSSITSAGCIYQNTNGGAHVEGTGGNASNGYNQQVVLQNQTAATDPLASLAAAPNWPLMPVAPSAPAGTNYTNVGPYLGYNTYSGTYGDCTYLGGSYSANCELYQGALTGLNNVGVNSLLLNEGTSSGTTYISGGLNINANNFITLNGSQYYVSGGMTLNAANTTTVNATSLNVTGGTTFSGGNSTATLAGGTYYFTGPADSNGTINGYGMNIKTPAVTVGPGTYYFNGGLSITNYNPNVTLGQGTYLFGSYTTSSGAMNSNYVNGVQNNSVGAVFDTTTKNLNFTGGTYYFDGGLTMAGAATVTFGPGIYYIRNGLLDFGNGSTVTANGATFVLEGNAGYQFDGGTAMTLSAPSTNCIPYTSYPEASYSLPSAATPLPNGYAPYDGTGGEGICDILIYQARGDTTPDNIIEGANSVISGIIYAPSAALNVTGGASISSATVSGAQQTLAIIQGSIALTGSGTINLTVAAGDPILTPTTTTKIMLIN